MWLAPSADEAESAAFVKSEAPAMKKSRKKKSSPPTVGFYTATRFQCYFFLVNLSIGVIHLSVLPSTLFRTFELITVAKPPLFSN
ncbi:hypothetical protein OUZ56_023400 [Daphnia magna]|uniref:Uncharacterized protein n=1 Tax=Daphnia magna TaxID=35525 RepID=A0ABR0AZ48_9CRUS|nr:hypothetical protein OUZ56_023400 [Daphnia magna]